MTKSEMHIAFKIELDKVESLQYPAFLSAEIDYFFDRAQDQFVKSRYSGNNPAGTSFEQTQKRIDDLRYLVVEDTLSAAFDDDIVAPPYTGPKVSEKPNCYIVDLTDLPVTDPYMFLVGEECTITYTDRLTGISVNKIQPITECSSNTYVAQVHDPLSPHRLHYNTASPLRLVKSDYIELITDGTYSVLNYTIRYLKTPTSFATLLTTESPDFPNHVHPELVRLAVNIAIENIESPRVQTYPTKVAEME